MQVKREARAWACLAVATLVGAALVPASASATTTTAPAGTVVAPSSTAVLTGRAGLTDDAVYGETADGIVTFPRDGSASDWSAVVVNGSQLTGHLLQAEGDALLVADLDDKADTLAWRTDDGGWSTRSVPDGTTLGRGGLFALLPSKPGDDPDHANWPIEDVTTGTTTVYTPFEWVRGVAVDGSTLWATSGLSSSLTAQGLPGRTGLRSLIEQGLRATDTLDVSGRWAVFTGADARVVDLDDVYADLDLGVASSARDVTLGTRTVAWLTPAGNVTIRELAGTRSTRTVGTALVPGLDADERGTTLAFVDQDRHVRLVDLSWATTPGTTIVDHATPPVPLIGLGARTVASPTISVNTYFAGDRATDPFRPSGATVEIRYHQHKTGVSTFGPWTTVHDGHLDLVAARATTTCFQARAHDAAGNYSAWSETLCGIVDGTAPHLTVDGPASATKAFKGKATVTVRYQATDDTWVKSYDVRYKKAAKGSTTYTAWVYPSSWQGTTAWSKSVMATTGQRVCLSVRARDGANNVTAWSSSRCTFADGTKPKLTKVVGPPRWYGVPKSGKVRATVRFAGKDDHALRFDVRVRKATVTGRLSSWATVAARTTKRSYTATLKSGQQACFEVRAHDTAGNVSAWSKARCTNVAISAASKTLKADHRATVSHAKVAVLKNSVPPRIRTWWDASIFQDAHARGIRLQVRTCPSCGTIQVQVGNKLMYVHTAAKKAGWKWVTLTWKAQSGYVTFDEKTPYPHPRVTKSSIRSWTLIR